MTYSQGDILKLQNKLGPFYVGQTVKIAGVNEDRGSVDIVAPLEPSLYLSDVKAEIVEAAEKGAVVSV